MATHLCFCVSFVPRCQRCALLILLPKQTKQLINHFRIYACRRTNTCQTVAWFMICIWWFKAISFYSSTMNLISTLFDWLFLRCVGLFRLLNNFWITNCSEQNTQANLARAIISLGQLRFICKFRNGFAFAFAYRVNYHRDI